MFQSQLVVIKVDARRWKLDEPLVFISKLVGEIVVPQGFETDFASVPRGLWNLFPPDGSYTAAAVVHDFLYRKTIKRRATCDKVFLEAMKACGTNWLARRIIYTTVRAFGWAARD